MDFSLSFSLSLFLFSFMLLVNCLVVFDYAACAKAQIIHAQEGDSASCRLLKPLVHMTSSNPDDIFTRTDGDIITILSATSRLVILMKRLQSKKSGI